MSDYKRDLMRLLREAAAELYSGEPVSDEITESGFRCDFDMPSPLNPEKIGELNAWLSAKKIPCAYELSGFSGVYQDGDSGKKTLQRIAVAAFETPEELRKRVTQRIDAELNAIGISTRFKGRDLLREAIFLLMNKDKQESDTVFLNLAAKHKTHYNNIVRNIQAAIQNAWQSNDIDTLERLYTAPVRRDLGAPTPTEFIHYYADKIRQSM